MQVCGGGEQPSRGGHRIFYRLYGTAEKGEDLLEDRDAVHGLCTPSSEQSCPCGGYSGSGGEESGLSVFPV